MHQDNCWQLAMPVSNLDLMRAHHTLNSTQTTPMTRLERWEFMEGAERRYDDNMPVGQRWAWAGACSLI